MLSPTQEENACLYLLDDLSPSEKSRFEAELTQNQELAQLVDELAHSLHTVATSLTPITPPQQVWNTLKTRIPSKTRHLPDPSWTWQSLGWPLAACLALGWTLTAFSPSASSTDHQLANAPIPSPRTPTTSPTDNPLLHLEGASETPWLTPSNPGTLALITNTEIRRLTAELEQTRATNQILSERVRTLDKQAVWLTYQLEEYLSAPPSGANRLLISRLSDPSTPQDAQPDMLPGELVAKSHQILVSQILSALQTGSTPVSTSTGSTLPTSESGMNSTPAPNNPAFTASASPSNLTPSDAFQSHLPNMDSLPDANSSSLASTPPTDSSPTDNSIHAAPPETSATTAFGIAVYDQQEALGTLIVDSLPQLNPNRSFQMWAVPVGSQEPVNIGLLPSMPYGGGQIQFSLPDFPGLPSRFLITEEPQLGSPSPTGTVILNTPGF